MKPRHFRILPIALVVMLSPLAHATSVVGTELDIGTGNVVLSSSLSGAVGKDNEVTNISFATGEGNTASNWSFSTGIENIATDYSSAVGCNNVAYTASLAGGYDSVMDAGSALSLVFGESNRIYSGYGVAVFGTHNNVNRSYASSTPSWSGGGEGSSFIAGTYNDIQQTTGSSGLGNIILGYNNGISSIPAGSDTTINSSVLIGYQNFTTKTEAWAIGKGNIAQTHAVTLGTYNAATASASLIVGNGTSSSARSNALVVLQDGTVQIPSGNLQLGSEAALTPTSVGTYLGSSGYLKRTSGTGASAGSGALLAWGDNAAAGSGSLAIGWHADATGPGNFAFGNGSIASSTGGAAVSFQSSYVTGFSAFGSGASTATGDNSVALSWGAALGDYSMATGGGYAAADYSIAIGGFDLGEYQSNNALGIGSAAVGGFYNVTLGKYSFATGFQNTVSAPYAVAMGSLNLTRANLLGSVDHTSWVETEALFELGNGNPEVTPYVCANAITTLKNGRTTLTNKFWNSGDATEVPTTTGSSDGEALVVEGHTVLKGNTRLSGKVTIDEPQGDISMGIYE